ncbi:hypothetical protein ZWY2020_035865 [Hordeum vulgare]|nr:hypothetical protein ZWY2020_035865 [Hordeum vulgare]
MTSNTNSGGRPRTGAAPNCLVKSAMMANGRLRKQALLPPRIPFSAASPSPSPQAELGPIARPREAHHRQGHQRTSSESVLVDEQPSWLDDLLDEPDSPARPHGRPGHRRSSSDSFTMFDGTTAAASAGMCGSVFDGMRTGGQVGSWGRTPEFFQEPSSFGRPQGQGPQWDPRQMFLQDGVIPLPVRDSMPLPVREKNGGHHDAMLNGADMKGYGDASHNHIMVGATRNDSDEHLKHSQSEADTKCAKQQYAQRSRVRKLQYIAELESRVQALQTQGVEVSAEMDFLGQQNIMLDLENKSLKQRLESLSQEHVIKRVQQEMFEREIVRLRLLFQQQQQQQQHILQQQTPAHSRSNSRDLDSQFASMSLKHNDSNSGPDAVPDLHI